MPDFDISVYMNPGGWLIRDLIREQETRIIADATGKY